MTCDRHPQASAAYAVLTASGTTLLLCGHCLRANAAHITQANYPVENLSNPLRTVKAGEFR